jgi:hypothetical protein
MDHASRQSGFVQVGLSSSEECARSAQDCLRHGINVVLA